MTRQGGTNQHDVYSPTQVAGVPRGTCEVGQAPAVLAGETRGVTSVFVLGGGAAFGR